MDTATGTEIDAEKIVKPNSAPNLNSRNDAGIIISAVKWQRLLNELRQVLENQTL